MSIQLHVPVIVFLHVNIETPEQLCQQIVRPVACICYRFFVCNNRIMRVAITEAGQAPCTYLFSLFCL